MKYKILCMLKENAPQYVSGEVLSKKFNVSRTAVWKNINSLVAEGYRVDASPRKGYRLVSLPDELNGFEIAYNLGTAVIGHKVLYFDAVDSTNNYARKIAFDGCDDGTVVIAGNQTAGRGRFGREWKSHENKGIYLSVVLKPLISPENIQIIPIAASVAVTKAIEAATGIRTGIKWPNDIILDNKKVCGISTEMNSEMEKVNFIILGIGINFSQKSEDFTPDLQDKAISLGFFARENHISTDIFKKMDLIRAVLCELENVYSLIINGNNLELIKIWKNYALTLNKDVRIIYRDKEYTGTAVDIANDGRLVVRCDDGAIREVLSGEVSVRGLLGYI